MTRPRWRIRGARFVFVAVVATQVALAINGYLEPHKYFAFQPFNESSTWRADIVRVTWDGERLPIEREWSGYDWDTLVHMSALQHPESMRHAYMGAGATLDFLDHTLDWVAAHTPADGSARYLEATVTYYENTRGPHQVVLRSDEREDPAMTTMTTAPADLFERFGDIRAMSLLRIVLGPITVAHLWPFLTDARAGRSYDDHFWQPYVSWAPHLPGDWWAPLLAVGVASAVLMSLGMLTRLTTATTFVIVAGNLLLSGTHFRHNRAFLAILLGGMALLPVGRVRSVDAWWRRRRRLPPLSPVALVWPLVLLRVQVSLIYLASGVSKLVDPDWSSGLVLWDRVVRYQHLIHPAPGWAVDLLTWRPLFYLAAPAAIATELFLAGGLWWPRTRLAAIRLALVFHLAIEISASVEVFSLAAVAALVIWVTPTPPDRTIRLGRATRRGRVLATAVPALDWLPRFTVETARPGDPDVVVVDRDGTKREGRAALRLILERLPVTFPFAPMVRS